VAGAQPAPSEASAALFAAQNSASHHIIARPPQCDKRHTPFSRNVSGLERAAYELGHITYQLSPAAAGEPNGGGDHLPVRTSQLINRLQQCAFGEISLTMTQLRAIQTLLNKSIPDLVAADIKSEQTQRYVVEVPPVLDRDEWQRKYGQNPRPPRLQ
jgi:hypothetical protein